MENFKAIEYHHTRDFSRKMNATFEFIRQNFKSLGKSILIIAGPPILVASLIIATFIDDFFGLARAAASNIGNPEVIETYVMSVTFWLQIVLMFLLFLISSIMSIATINNYIILYEEKQTNRIEVIEVWNRVRESFWMYFGTTIFFFVLGVVAIVIMAIPVGILAAISPFLVFLGIWACYFGIIYLMISVSLTYFVRAYEKKGFVESITRSFKLIQNKWWSTFGLLIILYMITGIASYIFIAPLYFYALVSTMHDTSVNMFEQSSTVWIAVALFVLYYFAQLVLGALPNIGIAFQYFNLVEMKEAKGLLGKIDTLGQSRPPSTSEEQY